MANPLPMPLTANEATALLNIDGPTEEAVPVHKNDFLKRNMPRVTTIPPIRVVLGVVVMAISLALMAVFDKAQAQTHHEFPNEFVWGAATSSYQIEGAATEGGKGRSIWDTYCEQPGHVFDNTSGVVACDHYHRVESDVKLMAKLGLKAYRFSISWPRIYPYGSGQVVNQQGIDFYNNLIDLLLEHGIEPWVTLYHWDLPQALQDDYGGWLGREIIDDFGAYARTCFQAFGDRVTHWITLNESWTVAVQSYNDGTKAPGRGNDPSHQTYLAGHHLVLAHARAAGIYKQEFVSKQKGVIGIANCGDFRYPANSGSPEDAEAADRAIIFQYAWLTDPFYFGDYPSEMKDRLGDRLPKFTDEERETLMGTTDFLGLNHYSSLYAAAPKKDPSYGGYWADMYVDFSSDPTWKKNHMGWSIVPDGCRELLLWISNRYDYPTIVMTENGSAEDEPDLATALRDEGRREYFEGYLRACAEAIDMGVNLAGYFAWSLMDNFEWEYGYTRRFGICRVDFNTQERTPKLSANWYSETIKANGKNIAKIGEEA
jgi:beta-galactosidase